MPRRASRIAFALVSALIGAVLLTGCGAIGGNSPTKTPTLTSTPTSSPTPLPTNTPRPTLTPIPTDTPVPTPTPLPHPALSSEVLPQGRTIVLNVVPRGDAASAVARWRGSSYAMVAEEGFFWLPLGASTRAALGPSPVSFDLYDAGGALLQTLEATVTVEATDFVVEYLELPVGGPSGLRTAEEVALEQSIRDRVYATFTPRQLWTGTFIVPVAGEITTAFGTARSINGAPPSLHHSGADFAADEGVAVVAAASGRIAFAGSLTVRGESVIIDHGAGVFTAYHHLSRIDVAEGQDVAQGQVVGAVGMTGLATGPHLHWELVVQGINVDPVYWTFVGGAP